MAYSNLVFRWLILCWFHSIYDCCVLSDHGECSGSQKPIFNVLFIGVQVELLNFVYLTQSTYMSKVPLMLWQPLGNHKVHGKSNIFKKFSLKLLSQSYLEFSYFEVYRKLPISIFLFIWWDFCVVVLLSQWCHGPLLY